MSKHPVDALRELGFPMSPEAEAEMRAICDEPVEIPRVITRVMDDGVQTKDGAA